MISMICLSKRQNDHCEFISYELRRNIPVKNIRPLTSFEQLNWFNFVVFPNEFKFFNNWRFPEERRTTTRCKKTCACMALDKTSIYLYLLFGSYQSYLLRKSTQYKISLATPLSVIHLMSKYFNSENNSLN